MPIYKYYTAQGCLAQGFTVPKIEICLKYFLDKNPQKQPLWDQTSVIKGRKFFYVIDSFPMTIVIFQ